MPSLTPIGGTDNGTSWGTDASGNPTQSWSGSGSSGGSGSGSSNSGNWTSLTPLSETKTDKNTGKTTTTYYDSSGNKTSRVVSKNGSTTTYHYDSSGRIVKIDSGDTSGRDVRSEKQKQLTNEGFVPESGSSGSFTNKSFTKEEKSEIEKMSKHGFGEKAEQQLKEQYGLPSEAKLIDYDPTTGEIQYTTPREYRQAKDDAQREYEEKMSTSEGFAEILTEQKEKGEVPNFWKTPIDWVGYQAEAARVYFGLKTKEAKPRKTKPGEFNVKDIDFSLSGLKQGFKYTGFAAASIVFGAGKNIVDIAQLVSHPVQTGKMLYKGGQTLFIASVTSAAAPFSKTASNIATQERSKIKTFGSNLAKYIEQNPYETAGGIVLDFATSDVVLTGLKPFTSKIKMGAKTTLGKLTGSYIPIEETGLKYVKGFTIPQELETLKRAVGKEGKYIHFTASPDLKGGLFNRKTLLKEFPSEAGGLRKAYDLYPFYKSFDPDNAGNVYLAYAGLSDDVPIYSKKAKQFSWTEPRASALIETDVLKNVPKSVEATQDITKINEWIQKYGSGSTFIAPENLVKASKEGQVISPAYSFERMRPGSLLEFSPRVTVRQKVGRLFGKEFGEKYTFYKQSFEAPAFIKSSETLSKFWERLTGKYTQIELLDVKTMSNIKGVATDDLIKVGSKADDFLGVPEISTKQLAESSAKYSNTNIISLSDIAQRSALAATFSVSSVEDIGMNSNISVPTMTQSYSSDFGVSNDYFSAPSTSSFDYSRTYSKSTSRTRSSPFKSSPFKSTRSSPFSSSGMSTGSINLSSPFGSSGSSPFSSSRSGSVGSSTGTSISITKTTTGIFNLPYKEEQNLQKGYDVFVRESRPKGKSDLGYIKVNKQPLPRQNAINLGADYTDRTTSTTFKIKPSKKKTSITEESSSGILFKFRSPRGKTKLGTGNVFVEKNQYRIDTWQELEGITIKGLLGQKRRGGTQAAASIYSGVRLGKIKLKGVKL